MTGEYQLRYAAGKYWLLDMKQESATYNRPICMNCVGADIWKLLSEGFTKEEIVASIQKKYEIEYSIAYTDCVTFLEQLMEQGVIEGV